MIKIRKKAIFQKIYSWKGTFFLELLQTKNYAGYKNLPVYK
jgi:hypothetical protein